MEDELFQFILKTEKIEYAVYDGRFQLGQFSPGLASFLSPDRIIEQGSLITDTFFELLGYEDILAGVCEGKNPPLRLDWINQTPLSGTIDPWDSSQPAPYYNLQVYPYGSGLLALVRDISQYSQIEQRVYNRHNELDILSRKLIDDLQEANTELNKAYLTTLEGWARALEIRDFETRGHSDRVSKWTRLLCAEMGILDADLAYFDYGALLHDIGKMGIPDRILLKPGPLDDAERQMMMQHPLIAENLLGPIKFLGKALSIPVYHHEKWDGSGYPYGLKGEQIPLAARIFTVVDVFDALTSHRPYRPAWNQTDCLDYIRERSGADFDPRVVSAFLSLFTEEPPDGRPK